MTQYQAGDLSIVIPTRGRADVLRRTVEAALDQTVTGHEVVVVVDGADEPSPQLPSDVRVLNQPHRGPGVARNTGVAAVDRRLVLFLGTDMIPTSTLV